MKSDREKVILEIAIRDKQVNVKKLARDLYASESSIRRDLNRLEKQNLLKRIHGGAILDENALSAIKIPFLIRELEKSDEKVQIASKAASYIQDGNVIFLDASTSAYNIIPYLAERKNIIVITNGIKALMKLAEYNINCIGTGGTVMSSCQAFIGEDSYKVIESYHADICFFSCRGLSSDGVLSDISQQENFVRQKMMQHSAKSYLLCTSDKIGKQYYHTLCVASELSGIISTLDLSDKIKQKG